MRGLLSLLGAESIMEDKIQLAHGGGGQLSHELIEKEIVSRFSRGPLEGLPDAATLNCSSKIVFSTDSFVVQPLCFPGGTIGDLAVHGTINDIAVAGGRPEYISLSLILEEGLELSLLRQILDSIKRAADECGVLVVTGDTKVVKKGQCDLMYINTAGIGEAIEEFQLSQSRIEVGDAVLVNGTLGDHGMAVMAAREELHLENGPVSDTGPVHRLVSAIKDFGPKIKFMRDPTRGGLASVLHEILSNVPLDIILKEDCLPFSQQALAVSSMLGIDLLHVASEGRLLVICDPSCAEDLILKWHSMGEGSGAVQIGHVEKGSSRLILETLAGGKRLVDMPQGELLPRIC